MVADGDRLAFRYLDREIDITRTRPKPERPPDSTLIVDLFLANEHDRTPIPCELKWRKDECALYALIQLLTQAAYAATRSQRERLVLFGSTASFVLQEALPTDPPMLDLYLLLVDPPEGNPHAEILPLAIELSRRLIEDPLVGQRIGRIAWIEAHDDLEQGLTLHNTATAQSKFRKPKR